MELPKISIVIPSYNKAKYIQETLDSICTQKYSNMEVIIQDGGSTDGTLEIIRKYADKYPNIIKWESREDKGQLDAINKGLKKASGEILTFINADDVYYKGTFGEVAAAYQNSPEALWFAGCGVVINEKGREIAKFVTWYKNLLLAINHYSLTLMINYLMQPSVFLTRMGYRKFGPFMGTKNFVMEYDLWLKLSRVQMPVVINKNLSKFRIEPNTKTKNLFNDLIKQDEKIVKRFTSDKLIIFLHKLNNRLRIIIEKLI